MTEPIPPQVALEQRLTEVLGTRDVHPDDRARIQDAFAVSQTWDELPQDIRDLIEELEELPRQSWADPADVPDDVYGS